VHVGLAVAQALPGSGEEVTAGPEHDRERQESEHRPDQSPRRAVWCKPVSQDREELRVREDDDRNRQDRREPELPHQGGILALTVALLAVEGRLRGRDRADPIAGADRAVDQVAAPRHVVAPDLDHVPHSVFPNPSR